MPALFEVIDEELLVVCALEDALDELEELDDELLEDDELEELDELELSSSFFDVEPLEVRTIENKSSRVP